MPLKEILAEQSQWTWNIMQRSAQLGEMIREDAITSINLAEIAHREPSLHVVSFQGAHLEEEYGADWLWGYGQSVYFVQAKRLDVIAKIGALSYTINLGQMDLIVSTSQSLSASGRLDAKPAYVFYNSMFDGADPQVAGCLFVNAIVLQNYLYNKRGIIRGQRSATLSLNEVLTQLNALPWFAMFGF